MARKSKKKQITVEQIDAQIEKWQAKLRRAVNAIDRLQRMRKRTITKETKAAAEMVKPIEAAPILTQVEALQANMAHKAPAESVERPAEKPAPTSAADDLAIPSFLSRVEDGPIGRDIADQIRAEQAELKKRKAAGRIAKMKAKQSGETKRMPLTGKAALAAIRG